MKKNKQKVKRYKVEFEYNEDPDLHIPNYIKYVKKQILKCIFPCAQNLKITEVKIPKGMETGDKK